MTGLLLARVISRASLAATVALARPAADWIERIPESRAQLRKLTRAIRERVQPVVKAASEVQEAAAAFFARHQAHFVRGTNIPAAHWLTAEGAIAHALKA